MDRNELKHMAKRAVARLENMAEDNRRLEKSSPDPYDSEMLENEAQHFEGMAAAIEALLAALESAEGREWVSVPREPTEAMLRAAQNAWLDDPMKRTTTMYKAMIDAVEPPK